METWPSSGLPQSVGIGYEMQPRAGLLDITEKRNTTRNRTYPEWSAVFTMIVSSSELANFRSFYDNTIKQSGAFTVPWLEILGFDFHFVQFTYNGPSWSSTEKIGYWELSLPLDVIACCEEDSSGINYYPPEES